MGFSVGFDSLCNMPRSCSSAQGGQKVLSAARAEAMLRSLLPDLSPARFQHVMRIMHNEFFVTLDPAGAGGCAGPLAPFASAPRACPSWATPIDSII
jgi:hypothetical protein